MRRIHAGDDMDLTERVIAMLILLYAQPLNRVTRLTLDDVTLELIFFYVLGVTNTQDHHVLAHCHGAPAEARLVQASLAGL